MSRRSSHRSERGFTMVELLVTLSVTVIGLTGVMAMYTSSARSNRVANETTAATSICERTLEQLRGMPVAEIAASFGDGELPFEAELEAVGHGHVDYARRLTAEPVPDHPNLVRLRVDVEWPDHRISLEVVRTTLERL